LQSRLAENSFATDGRIDMSGPVLRLQSLSPEDLLILLSNIRSVFALGVTEAELVPDEALHAFMDHCNRRIGEAYFRTPRNTIKAFVQFLSIIEQNPGTDWKELVGSTTPEPEEEPEAEADDELVDLRL
jgi:hypothetical protein